MDLTTITNVFAIVIVLTIAFFYLRKKHKKQKSYFGGPTSLTLEQKKTLEYYKSQYKPFRPDKRIPNLSRDNFDLEDVALTATKIVFGNPIPTHNEIMTLKTGNLVKLLFRDKDGEVERMWVEIKGQVGELYKGILRNDAVELAELKEGKTFFFHSNHVAEIWTD